MRSFGALVPNDWRGAKSTEMYSIMWHLWYSCVRITYVDYGNSPTKVIMTSNVKIRISHLNYLSVRYKPNFGSWPNRTSRSPVPVSVAEQSQSLCGDDGGDDGDDDSDEGKTDYNFRRCMSGPNSGLCSAENILLVLHIMV